MLMLQNHIIAMVLGQVIVMLHIIDALVEDVVVITTVLMLHQVTHMVRGLVLMLQTIHAVINVLVVRKPSQMRLVRMVVGYIQISTLLITIRIVELADTLQ